MNIEFYDFKENMILSESLDPKNVEHPKLQHVSHELHYGESFFEEKGQETVGLSKKIVNKKSNKSEKETIQYKDKLPNTEGGDNGGTGNQKEHSEPSEFNPKIKP